MYIFWHHFNPLFIFSCQNNVTISFIVEQDKIGIKSQLLLWTNLLYSSLCIKRKARMVQAHLDPDCWSGARYSTEAVAFVFSEERNDLCFLFVSLQLSFLVETARPTFPLRRGTNKNDTMLQSTDGSRCPRRKTRSTWASYIATKFFSEPGDFGEIFSPNNPTMIHLDSDTAICLKLDKHFDGYKCSAVN